MKKLTKEEETMQKDKSTKQRDKINELAMINIQDHDNENQFTDGVDINQYGFKNPNLDRNERPQTGENMYSKK